MRTNNWAFLISRSIYDSEIWKKPSDWLKIWIYILGNVNYQDNNLFKRWENLFRYDLVAIDCGCSYKSVENCMKFLKDRNQIGITRTARWAIISVNKYDEYQTMEKYKESSRNLVGIKQESSSDSIIEERNKGNKEIKEKRNNTYTESFEIFWKEYPNRVGKPDALKKYKEKEHPDIMDWLERWKEFWDYSETEPRFIPHPATWLNQERYKDKPPETKTKTLSFTI